VQLKLILLENITSIIYEKQHLTFSMHSRRRQEGGRHLLGINLGKSDIIRALNLLIWTEITGEDLFLRHRTSERIFVKILFAPPLPKPLLLFHFCFVFSVCEQRCEANA